jgi:tRNA-splicing ligase RtcB
MSCSHGAGRRLGRQEASRQLAVADCDAAMAGIVFDRWPQGGRFGRKARKGQHDLGEAPQAYKDIAAVIRAQLDLIEPVVRLRPLGVIKG